MKKVEAKVARLRPTAGETTATMAAYEAGRRVGRRSGGPWKLTAGTLAAALLAVAALTSIPSTKPGAVVAERSPAFEPMSAEVVRVDELQPMSMLALRQAALAGRPLPGPPGGGRTAPVPRAGDRGLYSG